MFPKRNQNLTGTPERSSKGPNQKGDRNGIDNFARHSHIYRHICPPSQVGNIHGLSL